MDAADIASDLIDFTVLDRVADVKWKMDHGLSHCDECGEGISPLRQSAGARRCMECQEFHEEQRRHYR